MSTALQEILDALPEADKHRAAGEILRRLTPATNGDVPESALIEAAENLFRALDTEELRIDADAQAGVSTK